jgi:hypothetical protein
MTFVVTTSAANMWISQTKQSKQSCNSMQFPHFYLGPPTFFVLGTYITEATLVVKPELPPECKPGSPRKPKIHWPEDGALPKGDAKKKTLGHDPFSDSHIAAIFQPCWFRLLRQKPRILLKIKYKIILNNTQLNARLVAGQGANLARQSSKSSHSPVMK